jgi:hypothetical protein
VPARGGDEQPDKPPAWTLAEAARYFTESGVPVTEAQLAGIIARLPRFPHAGRAPSGPQGGRGKALFPVAATMDLHMKLAAWL